MSEEEAAVVGQEAPDWKAGLPDDLRENPALAPFTDVANLAKGYVNASSMIGRDKIPLPGQHATAEDWSEVYDRLGRPESGEAYDLDGGEGADDNLMGWFRETAHSVGLNNDQAQKLLSAYNEMMAGQQEQAGPDLEALREQVNSELRQEYGNALDDRLSLANGIVMEFGGEEMTEIELADGSLLGDNPAFIKAMIGVGEYIRSNISEDAFEGSQSRSSMAMTPAEAQEKLRDIEAINGPLWDRKHPQHDYFVSERNRLYEEIYGAGASAS